MSSPSRAPRDSKRPRPPRSMREAFRHQDCIISLRPKASMVPSSVQTGSPAPLRTPPLPTPECRATACQLLWRSATPPAPTTIATPASMGCACPSPVPPAPTAPPPGTVPLRTAGAANCVPMTPGAVDKRCPSGLCDGAGNCLMLRPPPPPVVVSERREPECEPACNPCTSDFRRAKLSELSRSGSERRWLGRATACRLPLACGRLGASGAGRGMSRTPAHWQPWRCCAKPPACLRGWLIEMHQPASVSMLCLLWQGGKEVVHGVRQPPKVPKVPAWGQLRVRLQAEEEWVLRRQHTSNACGPSFMHWLGGG